MNHLERVADDVRTVQVDADHAMASPRIPPRGGSIEPRALPRVPRAHLAALLTLPVAITVLVPDWYYSDVLGIDPWLYTGFFRYLDTFATTLFPDTYYGTRLGWILPGRLAYTLFGATTGTLVLHATFYTASVLALYGTLRETTNPSHALFGALVFGTYVPAIRCLGDDYVAAAVVTYTLLATLLTMRAHRLASPWSAMGGGAFAAAMFHSNIVAAVLVPSILLWMMPWPVSRASGARTARLLTWWALGAVLCTAAIGEISALHGGRRLFFLPSITWMLQNGGTNPWDYPGVAWIISRPWALVPIACALAAGVALLSRARRMRLDEGRARWLAALALVLGPYVLWEFFAGGAPLFYDYYASWLLPTTFGVLVAVVVGTARAPLHAGVAVAAAVAMMIAALSPEWVRWVFGIVAGALVVTGAMAAGGLAPRAAPAAALVTAALVVLNAWLAPAYGTGLDRAETFRVADQAAQHVASRIDGRPPRFLATQGVPLGPFYNATASIYLWGYTVVTWDYPAISASDAERISPGTLVTIMSDGPGQLERFNVAAAPHGLRGELVAVESIDTSLGPFYLTFVRTHTAEPESGASPSGPA